MQIRAVASVLRALTKLKACTRTPKVNSFDLMKQYRKPSKVNKCYVEK